MTYVHILRMHFGHNPDTFEGIVLSMTTQCTPLVRNEKSLAFYWGNNPCLVLSSHDSSISWPALMKGLSKVLGLDLMHLYWTFKHKQWPSHFVNTGPDSLTGYVYFLLPMTECLKQSATSEDSLLSEGFSTRKMFPYQTYYSTSSQTLSS